MVESLQGTLLALEQKGQRKRLQGKPEQKDFETLVSVCVWFLVVEAEASEVEV